MTVGEIVKQWLEEHGCDGLCDPDAECGCGIDDLNPCGGLCDDCIPARRVEGEVGRMYVPIEDDQLGPTRQERIEQLHAVIHEMEKRLDNYYKAEQERYHPTSEASIRDKEALDEARRRDYEEWRQS